MPNNFYKILKSKMQQTMVEAACLIGVELLED